MIDQLREARYGIEALIALGFSPVLFAGGFVKLGQYRKIQNTPTCKIRSLPMGSVEVIGVARCDEPVVAPLTEKPAAWYEVEIQELRRQGGRGRRWVTRHKQTSETPFHVDDGTGRVLVLPKGVDATTRLTYDAKTSMMGGGVPPEAERYMERVGFRRGFARRLRFIERSIEIGGAVYLYGVAQERPDLRRIKTDRINDKLRALRADPEAMKQVDLDGDGEISDFEWMLARETAGDEVNAEGVDDRVAIARGEHGEMFVLSDREEKDLIGRLRLEAVGGVLGGSALFLGTSAYLLHVLGLLG